MSRAIMGSPPVTTTCPQWCPMVRATISSSGASSPSGVHEVYGVSHQEHRRLQPLVRMKTEGTPTSDPSPWMEWNSSAIFNFRLFESLLPQQAGIAVPAGTSGEIGVVATESERE